jgi:hypothetical protein
MSQDSEILNETINEIIGELDDKNLLFMSSGKIKELKNNILQKLYLTREELLHYHKVLKQYRYVDEIDEIKIGAYIRWFNLTKHDNVKLTNGGIILDMTKGKDDILIICKNNRNRIFSLNMNKCIIFQKISSQEQIIIKIVDYIQK